MERAVKLELGGTGKRLLQARTHTGQLRKAVLFRRSLGEKNRLPDGLGRSLRY